MASTYPDDLVDVEVLAPGGGMAAVEGIVTVTAGVLR